MACVVKSPCSAMDTCVLWTILELLFIVHSRLIRDPPFFMSNAGAVVNYENRFWFTQWEKVKVCNLPTCCSDRNQIIAVTTVEV